MTEERSRRDFERGKGSDAYMATRDNSIYYLLEAMIRRGLASTSNTWIEKAIAQRNPHLLVGVASSVVLVYDQLDAKILKITALN
jgi:hypothetical protein